MHLHCVSFSAPFCQHICLSHTRGQQCKNRRVTFHLPSNTKNSSCQEVAHITFCQRGSCPRSLTAHTRAPSGIETCLWLWPTITLKNMLPWNSRLFYFFPPAISASYWSVSWAEIQNKQSPALKIPSKLSYKTNSYLPNSEAMNNLACPLLSVFQM